MQNNYSSYYFVPSVLKYEKATKCTSDSDVVVGAKYLDLAYLQSIEIRRAQIKKYLAEFFEFENDYDLIDYLAANDEVLQILPHIANYILASLKVDRLTISLLNEDRSWKTLFINVYTKASWEESDRISENIFKVLMDTQPTVFEKVNFNFCQI